MKHPFRIFLLTLAGILLFGFAWFVLHTREPSYEGRTLTEWLDEANTNNVEVFPGADPTATNAIHQIGTNAIPTLLKLAATKDTSFRRTFLNIEQFLRDKWGFSINPISERELQVLSCRGFYWLGPKGKPAVPRLIALLHDKNKNVREVAAYDLGYIGPDAEAAVPELDKEFTREASDTNYSDYAAAWAIGQIGPSARSAIPMLTAGLTNQSLSCRLSAQAALIKLQAISISPVLENLKDTSDETQWTHAMMVVLGCGTNAAAAVPLFISALNCTNQAIQNKALSSLGYVHLQPISSVPAIIPLLASKNDYTRVNAIRVLRKFGSAGRPSVPALLHCLEDPENAVRIQATNALREIDREAAAKAGIK